MTAIGTCSTHFRTLLELKLKYAMDRADIEAAKFLGACYNGDLSIVYECVELGVDINVNGYGLWVACDNNHLEIVRFLLENGAKITSNGTFDYISKYLGDWDIAKTAIIEYKLRE